MHLYLDETKGPKGIPFVLACAVVEPHRADHVRRTMAALRMPGQRSVHMVDEKPPRKQVILQRIGELADVHVVLYRAGAEFKRELDRRDACLERVLADHATDTDLLVRLGRDVTLVPRDQATFARAARRTGRPARYEHTDAGTEPLLLIPDAVAWAWQRGGDWRRRTQTVITAVIDV